MTATTQSLKTSLFNWNIRNKLIVLLLGMALVPAGIVLGQYAASPAQASDRIETASSAAAAVRDHGADHPAPAKSAAPAHGAAHWAYTGAAGPQAWGRLSRDFAACEKGRMQSPVNIEAHAAEKGNLQKISFDYRPVPLNIVHNGHTVQVNYSPGSSVTIGTKKYELLQFHFHTPSEHAIGGARSSLEVHFVHKNSEGKLAVVGVLLDSGQENIVLQEIWNHLPTRQGPAKAHNAVVINARDLLPTSTGYYRYMGSLTTPPCSEGVNWYVMDEKISVGAGQVSKFETAVGKNARPLQAFNDRMLIAPVAAH